MITELTETNSSFRVTVTAESGNYRLNATAVIEDGKIVARYQE